MKDWLLWQRDKISSVIYIWPCGHFPKCKLYSRAGGPECLWHWKSLEGRSLHLGPGFRVTHCSCYVKGDIGLFFWWTGGDGNLSAQLHFCLGSHLPGGYRGILHLAHSSPGSTKGCDLEAWAGEWLRFPGKGAHWPCKCSYKSLALHPEAQESRSFFTFLLIATHL